MGPEGETESESEAITEADGGGASVAVVPLPLCVADGVGPESVREGVSVAIDDCESVNTGV